MIILVPWTLLRNQTFVISRIQWAPERASRCNTHLSSFPMGCRISIQEGIVERGLPVSPHSQFCEVVSGTVAADTLEVLVNDGLVTTTTENDRHQHSTMHVNQHLSSRRGAMEPDTRYVDTKAADPPSDSLLKGRLIEPELQQGMSLMNHLGTLLIAQGDLEGAETLFREALAMSYQVLGERHAETSSLMNNLGGLLKAQGDLDGAEQLLSATLRVRREGLGSRHESTLTSMNNMATLLFARGDLEGAELLFRESLVTSREVRGNKHVDTLSGIYSLGRVLLARDDLAGAEPLYREALALSRELLGAQHPNSLDNISLDNISLDIMYDLASLLEARGDLEGAALLFCEELIGSAQSLGFQDTQARCSALHLAI